MKYKSMNPFDGIIETEHCPHSRTLRTSFWQKIKDTFTVIVGTDAGTDNYHPGLVQYITFFSVDAFMHIMSKYSKYEDKLFYKIPFILFGYPLLTLYLVVLIGMSVLGFLIALPIVGFVQSCTYFIAGKDKEAVLAMEVYDENNSSIKSTLQSLLKEHKLDLEKIEIATITAKDDNTASYEVEFKEKIDEPVETFARWKEGYEPLSFKTILTATKHHPFFRLNIGNVEGYCEKECKKDILRQFL